MVLDGSFLESGKQITRENIVLSRKYEYIIFHNARFLEPPLWGDQVSRRTEQYRELRTWMLCLKYFIHSGPTFYPISDTKGNED